MNPSDTKNNGGSTDYYALPPDATTLNDLIESQGMQPWQHEVFKAVYALEARAKKNGGSRLREINKILYYAERGKALELARLTPDTSKPENVNTKQTLKTCLSCRWSQLNATGQNWCTRDNLVSEITGELRLTRQCETERRLDEHNGFCGTSAQFYAAKDVVISSESNCPKLTREEVQP